jgi:propanediol dehydratase large subunit
MANSQNNWARYDLWDERHLSHDRFAVEDPENGFCAAASPHDPKPSLVIEHGRVIEMDSVPASEFDMIDEFLARP